LKIIKIRAKLNFFSNLCSPLLKLNIPRRDMIYWQIVQSYEEKIKEIAEKIIKDIKEKILK